MAPTNLEEHVFQLSTIDQALDRTYIRCCVGFPCERKTAIQLESKLTASVKRTVVSFPILAGTVKPVLESYGQQNRVEVTVTVNDVNNFKTSITRPTAGEFQQSFPGFKQSGMPPSGLLNECLGPLPHTPDTKSAPVFGVRMNQVAAGIIVSVYLHHSVADIASMKMILKQLSADLSDRALSNIELRNMALEHSRLRDRLSGSRGIKASEAQPKPTASVALEQSTRTPESWTCRVFTFDLKFFEKTKKMINDHLLQIRADVQTHVTDFTVLAAVLWKGISRARCQVEVPAKDQNQHITTVTIPVDIRAEVHPPLERSYFGNATLTATTELGLEWLAMPYDASSLALAARLIQNSTNTAGEQKLRQKIADINESSDVQAAPIEQVASGSDLLISNWADLGLEEAHLGLGLGNPGHGRQLGKTPTSYACVVHGKTKMPGYWSGGGNWVAEEGLWEVTVEVPENVMDLIMRDEAFAAFVKYSA